MPAMQLNRVTLRIDVPFTDHSHVIGRGGRNIKAVMSDTHCHIHFPDSNRTNLLEKSNQVSISGDVTKVDRARQRIRDMLPVMFTFDLPVTLTAQQGVLRHSSFVRHIENDYGVEVCFRNVYSFIKTHTTVNVKSLSANSRRTKTAVQLLLHKYYGQSTLVPIKMTMEMDPAHQVAFLGQKTPDELTELVMQATGATLSFRSSRLLNRKDTDHILNDSVFSNFIISELNGQNAISKERLLLTAIELTGTSVESVFLARQLVTNLLPVVLIFHVAMDESIWLRDYDFTRLQQELDVCIAIRNKPEPSIRSVVVQTIEKNVRALYSAWHLITGFLTQMNSANGLAAPKLTLKSCGNLLDLDRELAYRFTAEQFYENEDKQSGTRSGVSDSYHTGLESLLGLNIDELIGFDPMPTMETSTIRSNGWQVPNWKNEATDIHNNHHPRIYDEGTRFRVPEMIGSIGDELDSRYSGYNFLTNTDESPYRSSGEMQKFNFSNDRMSLQRSNLHPYCYNPPPRLLRAAAAMATGKPTNRC